MDKNVDETLFRRLIEPLGKAQFVADIWEQTSLFLPGFPTRFAELGVDFDRFADALGSLPPGSIRANRVGQDGQGIYIPVTADECQQCFAQDMTICVTDLHRGMADLRAFAQETRRELGLAGAVGVNAYLSPAGRGFGLHFDMQSVFIMQIEGEKHWLYGNAPAVTFPPQGMDAYPDAGRQRFRNRNPDMALAEPQETQWKQCLLRPGDALYLPPGTWHQGTAGDYSLALTLTCCTRDFASLLLPILQRSLLMREPWRRNLPCHPLGNDGAADDAFVADRLAEFQQWAATLSSRDLAHAWDLIVAEAPDLA